jgi:hypothetical protein
MRKNYYLKLIGTLFVLCGLMFLASLFMTVFDLDIGIFDNFFAGGLLILANTLLGKSIIFLVAIFLIISGVGVIQQKNWGKKITICLSFLMVLFLIYLSIGIIGSIFTGHQTAASLTIAIGIPFLMLLLISILGIILLTLKEKGRV